jgi:hypothetical protein
MFVGLHRSWNRNPKSGYKVVFVPFSAGRPLTPMVDVLTDFLDTEGRAQGARSGWRSTAKADFWWPMMSATPSGASAWRHARWQARAGQPYMFEPVGRRWSSEPARRSAGQSKRLCLPVSRDVLPVCDRNVLDATLASLAIPAVVALSRPCLIACAGFDFSTMARAHQQEIVHGPQVRRLP